MSANRLTQSFAQTVANSAGPLVACVAPLGVVVMIAAPHQIAALQRQMFELAQRRARQALAKPQHLRLLENWN